MHSAPPRFLFVLQNHPVTDASWPVIGEFVNSGSSPVNWPIPKAINRVKKKKKKDGRRSDGVEFLYRHVLHETRRAPWHPGIYHLSFAYHPRWHYAITRAKFIPNEIYVFRTIRRFIVYVRRAINSAWQKPRVEIVTTAAGTFIFCFHRGFEDFCHTSNEQRHEKNTGTCEGFEMNILFGSGCTRHRVPTTRSHPPSFTVVTAICCFASWPLKFQP